MLKGFTALFKSCCQVLKICHLFSFFSRLPSIYDQELREKYQSLNTIVLESDACPLNGICQVERSIYQATVTCDNDPIYGE